MMKDKYLVLTITCWVLLSICIILKLFGAAMFAASSNNETFINFCNYIQNSFLFYIVTPLFNITSTCIFLMAVLKVKKPDWRWLTPYIAYAILKTIFYKYNILFFILDILVIIIIPLLVDYHKWLRIIICVIINLSFQLVSMFLKLDHYKMFDDNLVVGIILSIDYYIMLILMWLYSIDKKKEETK